MLKIIMLSACLLAGCTLAPEKLVLGYGPQQTDDSNDAKWNKVCPPNKAHVCGLGLDLSKDGVAMEMYLVEENPGTVRMAFLMPAGSRSQATLFIASDGHQLSDLPFMQCNQDICGGVWVPTRTEWSELRSGKAIILEYQGDVRTSFMLPVDKLQSGLTQLPAIKGK